MKWVTYRHGAGSPERIGLVVGSEIHGLEEGLSLLEVLCDDQTVEAAARASSTPIEVVAISDVQLLSPLPQPPSIRDFMAFEAHITNALKASGLTVDPSWYDHPCFYFSNPAAVYGPDTTVPISPGSLTYDFELEIAAVIGREGRDLLPSEASDYIAGYTILCDWSARDIQRAEVPLRLGPAKGKDGATSLGPMLITPDELAYARTERGYDLTLEAFVNGVPYSRGNWSDIHWSFEQMIAYASRGTRVVPGDVFGSGTVGTGCLVELRQLHDPEDYPWLTPGDEVEFRIEGLGSLRSRVGVANSVPTVAELLRS